MKSPYKTNLEKLEIITDALVSDIVNLLKKNVSGYYYLPEETTEEALYIFGDDINALTLEVHIHKSVDQPQSEVDGEYYNNENTIKVEILYNQNEGILKVLDDIIPELHELITHEVVHFLQEESGYKFPNKVPKKPFNYYSQPHELEAQIKGFEKRSKVSSTEIKKVMKAWFKKYPQKHNLTTKEVNKLISKLLENYGKQ
jgi:hypothetical protein